MNGISYALLASLGWAVNGVVYKLGLRDVSPFTANFHRTLFATIFLGLLTILSGQIFMITAIDWFTWLILVVSALFSFYLGDLMYLSSLKRSQLSVSLPLASTYPIYVVLLAPVFYGVNLEFKYLVSALLVFLAVYILYGRKNSVSTSTSGILLALGAALSWSAAILSLDFLTSRLSVDLVGFIRMAFAFVLLSLSTKSGEIGDKNSIIFAGVAGGAITSISIILFITAVSVSGSWMVSQPSATSPILGALLGKIIFREKIDARLALSIILIILSISLLLL